MLHDFQSRWFISFVLMLNIEDIYGAKEHSDLPVNFPVQMTGSIIQKISKAHMVRLSDEISNKHPQTAWRFYL